MSQSEILSKVKALQEWQALLEEATAEIESLKDAIKTEMNARGVEEMDLGEQMVRWTTIQSFRLDTTSLKKYHPDVYLQYIKQVTSRRFTITG